MNISFKEIKKYPFTYIENIIKYNDSESLYILLQYGPYLAMNYDISNYNKSLSYFENGIVKRLFDTAEIIKYFDSYNNTIASAKKFLISKSKSLPADQEMNTYTSPVKAVCENCISNIKSFQYTNKLMEGSMTNFSPIVSYMGIIKQPGLTESMSTNTSNKRNNLDTIIELLNKSDKEILTFIKETFYSELYTILLNCDKFIENDNYNEEYGIKEDSEKKLSYKLYSSLTSDIEFNIISVYFAIVYLYYSFERSDYSNIIDTLNSMNKSFDEGTSFNSAMEYMIKFDMRPINESLLDVDIIKNMEYENDKKIYKLMDMANIDSDEMQSKNYKLDKLLAYLYNSRKYKTDAYTNSLFLNDNDSVSGYSYIENAGEMILVCEIDDKTLCIPVIDLSDNHKMKLITMDKEDNINVTTNFKTKDADTDSKYAEKLIKLKERRTE